MNYNFVTVRKIESGYNEAKKFPIRPDRIHSILSYVVFYYMLKATYIKATHCRPRAWQQAIGLVFYMPPRCMDAFMVWGFYEGGNLKYFLQHTPTRSLETSLFFVQ